MDIQVNDSLEVLDILEERSKEKVEELIPVIVIVTFLLVLGLVGNTSVLVFFWRRANHSVANFFIVTLAVVDTLVCLTIALIIMDLSLAFKYPSNVGCKIHSFCKFFTAMFSGFILLTIAVHRYRMICVPFKKQLTLRAAKIVVMICMIISILLCTPIFFVYERTEFNILGDYNVNDSIYHTNVTGMVCAAAADAVIVKLNAATNYIFFFIFIATSITLIVLYSLQARKLYKINRARVKLEVKYESNEESCSSAVTQGEILDKYKSEHDSESDNTPLSDEGPNETTCYTKEHKGDKQMTGHLKQNNKLHIPTFYKNTYRGSSYIEESKEVKEAQHTKENTTVTKDQISVNKISAIFFVIALGFILSFCPYIFYALRRNFTPQSKGTSRGATIENQLLTNSYLLNSVINPIIYGIIHTEFKQFLRRHLCCWRRSASFTT